MNAWLVVLAVGLGSYLFRLSVVLVADRFEMPASLQQATGLIAPGAFAAIAAAGIATACLGVGRVEAIPPLVAAAVAVMAVALTGRPYAAVLAGMPTLWLATALVHLAI
jgi:branched-subunit amino acid transport protein